MINIVLIEPEIPANTGNIGRSCAATGSRLHLIEPLGFQISDKHLKRAGLDYWDKFEMKVYPDLEDFFRQNQGQYVFASTKGKLKYTDIHYDKDCYIFFGKETKGIDEQILLKYYDLTVRIPMGRNIRSLNLSNSAAIILYEALRQNNFFDLETEGSLIPPS
ncbi:MAG: tRNA (cytidine(34)-2'-O)-methyltransferase [Christensenellales bacterium]|jgi:tRNA (cytidine/uridine-2'-O-)-methyltransferase